MNTSDQRGPAFWATRPSAFKTMLASEKLTPNEAKRRVEEFKASFPDMASWMKWQKDSPEAMRAALTSRIRSDVPNAANIPKADPVVPGLVTPRVGYTRKELDERYREFLREVKRNRKALRYLSVAPKKPTANWLVRAWRKLIGWERPAKPGRKLLDHEGLFWWARELVVAYESRDLFHIRTFYGGIIFFKTAMQDGELCYQCSTFGASSLKSLQYGLRVGPVENSMEEALAEFRAQYPGLFDGTVHPRTSQEAAWWFQQRQKLTAPAYAKPIKTVKGETVVFHLTHYKGVNRWSLSIVESGEVLWRGAPCELDAPQPDEALMTVKLARPNLFQAERFRGYKGHL